MLDRIIRFSLRNRLLVCLAFAVLVGLGSVQPRLQDGPHIAVPSAVQVFDSWAGVLAPCDFKEFARRIYEPMISNNSAGAV